MKSYLTFCSIPVLVAAGSLAAFAQDPTTPPAPAPAEKFSVEIDKNATNSEAAPMQGSFAAAQAAGEMRSTKLVGLTVYNDQKETIGDINDLILGGDGKVTAVVIGVGGFLGMGEKSVAVPYSDLKFSRNESGTVRVSISASKASLESAPTFKYYEKS